MNLQKVPIKDFYYLDDRNIKHKVIFEYLLKKPILSKVNFICPVRFSLLNRTVHGASTEFFAEFEKLSSFAYYDFGKISVYSTFVNCFPGREVEKMEKVTEDEIFYSRDLNIRRENAQLETLLVTLIKHDKGIILYFDDYNFFDVLFITDEKISTYPKNMNILNSDEIKYTARLNRILAEDGKYVRGLILSFSYKKKDVLGWVLLVRREILPEIEYPGCDMLC